jgi:hypothetical protein
MRDEALTCVGPGWACLINYFYTEADKSPMPIYITQVKEKFAGIRIYWSVDLVENVPFDDNEYESLHRLTSAMEDCSRMICESCGNRGKLYKDKGWFLTLCENCKGSAEECFENPTHNPMIRQDDEDVAGDQ